MAAFALRDAPPAAVPQPARIHERGGVDPLRARLRTCRQAGQAAASDPECLRAWDENRRRFLGHRYPEPPEPDGDEQPGKSTEPVPIAPEESGASNQEQ